MFIALAVAAILAAGAPATDPGARISEAAAAAEALQGPLDGRWLLRGERGRTLYEIEFSDPAGGQGRLTGAWRDPRDGAEGFISDARRAGRRLTITLQPRNAPSRRLRLTRTAPDLWTGTMEAGPGSRHVAMARR